MQPKTYIYSKPAFFRLILSGFHFTEKRKKLSFGNKNENKRGQFVSSCYPSEQTGHSEGKRNCAGRPIQVFRHSLIGCFLSEIET